MITNELEREMVRRDGKWDIIKKKQKVIIIMELLITEQQLRNLNEDVNPYKKRWTTERSSLKKYIVNYGETMI